MLLKDNNGNKIYSQTRNWEIKYYLLLKWAQYPRTLWTYKGWILYIKRDKEKHLYEKLQAYWFNDTLLKHLAAHWDVKIVVSEVGNKKKYNTSISYILEHWQYLHFATQWFELQIFMPLSKMDG